MSRCFLAAVGAALLLFVVATKAEWPREGEVELTGDEAGQPWRHQEDDSAEMMAASDDEALEQRVRRVPLALIVKRALSLFNRWSTNKAGQNRYQDPGRDFVSAVARDISRPRGQPLRWG